MVRPARRLRRLLLPVLLLPSLAACGEGPDYAAFRVSCARARCPAGLCCDADRVCVEGRADAYGECPAPAPGGQED